MNRKLRWSSLIGHLPMGLWAGLLLLLMPASMVQAQTGSTVRVLSYNIHHGQGVDGKLDLPRIAKVIRTARPDLVALQEVDRETTRTQGVDQGRELARLTDMQFAFGENIQFGGGGYGNAVLSRFPIVSHQNHLLPNRDQGEQRGALEVIVQWNEQTKLRIVSTHLDHRRDERERKESATRLEQLLSGKWAQPATILAGDMNAIRTSDTMQQFARRWQIAGDEELSTHPAGQPRRQIDFIMASPSKRWRTQSVTVIDEPLASDHRPVLAVLELLPQEQQSK